MCQSRALIILLIGCASAFWPAIKPVALKHRDLKQVPAQSAVEDGILSRDTMSVRFVKPVAIHRDFTKKSRRNADVSDCFSNAFGKCEFHGQGDCIEGPVSKARDLLGGTVSISSRSYKSVNLTETVNAAGVEVYNVLCKDAGDREKGPVTVVRGVGGGKTTAMVALQKRLRENADILTVLITFNSLWWTRDFGSFRTLLGPLESELVYALAVVSRMASICYKKPHLEIIKMISNSVNKFKKVFAGTDASKLIPHFAMYLARQARETRGEPIRDIVLLVDEVVKGDEELATHFPQERNGAKYLHDAMLNFNFSEFSHRGALVLSGLHPSIAGATDSGKLVRPFVLSEALNPEAVVDHMFLTDVDADGSTHPIRALLADCSSNSALARAAAHRALTNIATVFNSLPRALEFAQDELRRHVNRTDLADRTLTVSAPLTLHVFDEVLERFKQRYPVLLSIGLPDADLMYALVFGRDDVPIDDRVLNAIRTSLFTNSLTPAHFTYVPTIPSKIALRSSIVSLHAAAQSCHDACSSSIRDCVLALFETVRGWVGNVTAIHELGSTLETLQVDWLRLLLSAAVNANKRSVPVADLLKCTADISTGSTLLRDYLRDSVSLPVDLSLPISVHQLNSTCYVKGTNETSSAALVEMNRIELTDEMPVAILRAAPLDYWDYALAFLGAPNPTASMRPIRVIFFVTKVADELIPVNLQQSYYFPQLRSRHKSGIGSVVARKEHVFIHQTTQSGESAVEDAVITMRNADCQRYFNFMYDYYVAMKSAVVIALC